MELKTKNQSIVLVFTTRKLVKITDILKGKNFEDLYFKSMNEGDVEALSKILFIFAEKAEDGTSAFKNSDEVYDFIDDYKQENNKTYNDIFKEIAEVINSEGFFKRKMNKKELEDKTSNPLSGLDMNSLVKQSAEKAIEKMAMQEMNAMN